MAKKVEKKAEKKPAKKTSTNFLQAIMKDMGKTSVKIMSSSEVDTMIPWKVPFRHIGLQLATGGLLGGKMMEIQAESQAGKSFLLYELMAQALEMGGYAFLCDAEQAFEPAYGEKIGLTGQFLYDENVGMEDFFNNAIRFMESVREHDKDLTKPIILGVDSFAGLSINEQLEAEEKEKDLGYGAMKKNKVWYDQLRRIQPLLPRYGASLVVLNQLRKKQNVTKYEEQHRSLADDMKYFMTQRIKGKLGKKIAKVIQLKGSEVKQQTGMSTNWEVIKNRFVEPFQKIETKILFRNGLQVHSGLINFFLRGELITMGTRAIAKADGSEGKKTETVYKVKADPEGRMYLETEIEKMIEENPSLLIPKYTSKVDDSEYNEVEESIGGDDSDEVRLDD